MTFFEKTVPEIRCYVDLWDSIDSRSTPGLVIAQLVGDRMGFAQGDSFHGINPTARAWSASDGSGNVVPFQNVSDNIEFVRFHNSGRASVGASPAETSGDELAGFTLKPREIPVYARVNGQVAGSSSGETLDWQTVSGTHSSVRKPTGGTSVVNTSFVNKEIVKSYPLAANQGFLLDITCSLKSSDTADAERAAIVSWGSNMYRVYLEHGVPPRIDNFSTSLGTWVSLRRLDGATPVYLGGGRVTVGVWRWAGRLIVRIGSQHYHFLEARNGESRASEWPAGNVVVETTRCRAVIEMKLLSFTDENGAPQAGTYEDVSPYKGPSADDVAGLAAGWMPTADSVTINIKREAGKITQQVTIRATADGSDAGFVTRTMKQFSPRERAGTPTAIDIGSAIVRAQLSQAMPPIMPGGELTLEVDRVLLENLFASAYPGKDWRDHAREFCPVRFESRWHYGGATPSPWVQWFSGYINLKEMAGGEVDNRRIAFTCRDRIVRLQNPQSMIDHRWPPMDLWFSQKMANRRAAGAQSLSNQGFYGAEAVYEILRIALGQDEADRLNGGIIVGTGFLDYFPSSHYPLLSAEKNFGYLPLEWLSGVGQPPSNGSWIFPPPVGEDALSWINQIAAKDHAIFFYGHGNNGYDGNYPHPVYGRITNIIANRQVVHYLNDTVYRAGDLADFDAATLFQEVSWSNRPENNINRVVVMANGALGDGMSAILPAARIAVAELAAGSNLTEEGWQNPDFNAAQWTWERTKIIRDELSWFPGAAEAYAKVFISLLRNIIYRWPSITCIGRAHQLAFDPPELPINWGDKVVLKMDGTFSDSGMDMGGIPFRVEHVEQTWEFDQAATHTMQAWLRPLTSGGV